jgi:hypothetical protein
VPKWKHQEIFLFLVTNLKKLVSLLIEVVELVENIVLVSDVVVVVVATKMKLFLVINEWQ